MSGPGPIGYIIHQPTRKLIHPKGGSRNPGNDTPLVLHSDRDDPARLQVRFVPVQDHKPFGYIEHVPSGKIIHPAGGKANPGDNTPLVYHEDRHQGALFKFDEEYGEIQHIGGKVWHPRGGSTKPKNDTACVLHGDRQPAARFYFGDVDGNHISPYPSKKRRARK